MQAPAALLAQALDQVEAQAITERHRLLRALGRTDGVADQQAAVAHDDFHHALVAVLQGVAQQVADDDPCAGLRQAVWLHVEVEGQAAALAQRLLLLEQFLQQAADLDVSVVAQFAALAAEPEQGLGHLLHAQRRAADALQGMRGGRAAGLVEQLQVHADHRQRGAQLMAGVAQEALLALAEVLDPGHAVPQGIRQHVEFAVVEARPLAVRGKVVEGHRPARQLAQRGDDEPDQQADGGQRRQGDR
ncbi:hypothetical protein V554_01105 [Pseudomonas aeruginosa BWH053]|nr:hypothetical protein V554_01105 [Pseudomonas aeruginosa BWH053]